ncbi:MltR family transcriptional regulator [Caballeronia sp. LZ035]|uniref:MltR family transcriptional regulator n=1 Tax=Caballeronia sp. LZ035 TaxID=3038568 RepID=UPI002861C284|nr:MltR family transcriptional regulator [Caballeronia sp. LZ035]MDR5759752.1 MltR family transcriptional regulator [Caballeronia sp. LZ035]
MNSDLDRENAERVLAAMGEMVNNALAHIPDGPSRERVRDVFAFRTSLTNESDRGAALMAAAFIDDRLMLLLKSRIVDDKKVSRRAFEFNGPLGTFSARIDFCYLLGLIPKNARRDLHLIRSIRNKFAHQAGAMDFDDDSVRQLCESLAFHGVKPAASAGSKFRRSVMGILTLVVQAMDETTHIEAKLDYAIPDGTGAYKLVADVYKTIVGGEYILKHEHE